MNKYNIILIIPIFLMCYAWLVRHNARKHRKRYEALNTNINSIVPKKQSKYLLLPFFQNKQQMLEKQGNPFGLNAIGYYISKIIIALVLFALASSNYNSMFFGLIFGIIGFFVIDFYMTLHKKMRDSAIRVDLFNVVDSLNMQLSAHLPLNSALINIPQVCRHKQFKTAVQRFISHYELTGYNIEEATATLESRFDILELNVFCTALKQHINSGSAIEILSNLSDNLKENYLDRLNKSTKLKIIYITFGVLVILVNILAITFFPIFVHMGENMREIFR